jgi:hypothetical protein
MTPPATPPADPRSPLPDDIARQLARTADHIAVRHADLGLLVWARARLARLRRKEGRMSDIPPFERGSAAELAWARAVLREQRRWRSVVSGESIIAMARRIVGNAASSGRTAPAPRPDRHPH